jgi:hypothetical protein
LIILGVEDFLDFFFCQVDHGFGSFLWLVGFGFHGTAEDLVAQFAGAFQRGGSEALAHAALGVVRKMEGVVAPESAVVVPEVVVRIVRLDADGCCLFHGVLPFGFAPGFGTNKKPLPGQERRFDFGRGVLLFGPFGPHIAWLSKQATVGFSPVPRLAPCGDLTQQEFLMMRRR